jgi:hypothetical protein
MAEPNPEKTRDALLALAGLFAPGDAEVKRQTLLAHDDPEGYVKALAARLDERGIDSPEPNLTVIALSDALQERQRVFIVDHRSPAEDIEGGLRTTLTALGLDAAKLLRWYDEAEWINTNAAVFLKRCGNSLAAFGYALVHLDIGSDGWEVTVIPFDEVTAALEHGSALGLGKNGRVTSLSPRKRPEKEPKAARVRPPTVHETFALPEGYPPQQGGHGEGSMLWTTKETERRALEIDLSTWPPTLHELLRSDRFASHLATSTAGARVVSTASPDNEALKRGETILRGAIVLLRPGASPVDLLPRLGRGVEVQRIGFVGDGVVVLPTEPSFRGNAVDRPLLWEGGEAFRVLDELPIVKVAPFAPGDFPPFVRQGFARTGNGDDVLIWEGRGWIREDGRFVARYELGELDAGAVIPTVRGAGDTFFLKREGRLRQARKDGPPVALLPKVRSLYDLAPGPDGTVIASKLRYGSSKSPLAVVYDPSTGKHFDIAPHLLDVRKDDTPELVRYSAATDRLVALYGSEVRSVPWAVATAG